MAGRLQAAQSRLTLDLQEGRQQLVLVLLGGYRIRQLLAVVEGLQQGLEAVVDCTHRGSRRAVEGRPGCRSVRRAQTIIFCPASQGRLLSR